MKLASIVSACLLLAHCGATAHGNDLADLDLGVEVVELSEVLPVLKKTHQEPPTKIGVSMTSVIPWGPAGVAHIKENDILVTLNLVPIKSGDALANELKKLKAGEEYKAVFYQLVGSPSGRPQWQKRVEKVTPVIRRKLILDSLKYEEFDFGETIVCQHRQSSHVMATNELMLSFITGGKRPARMTLSICRQSFKPLRLTKYALQVDDEKFFVVPSKSSDIKTEFINQLYSEFYTLSVDDKTTKLVEALSTAKVVIVNYEGETGNEQRELQREEINRIKTVYQAFLIKKEEEAANGAAK